MLLLASASPARRRLLEQAGIPFEWQVSGVDEEALSADGPEQLVQALARAKAEAVWRARGLEDTWRAGANAPERAPGEANPKRSDGRPMARGPASGEITAVLGCDSLLCFEGEVFGKPADAAMACERWQRMSGRRASLLTGYCWLSPMGQQLTTVTTVVQFATLSDAEINRYVASGEPLACAGGFALEGQGGMVVERLEGCWSNVIGLSLPLLRRWLAALGASPLGEGPGSRGMES